MSLDAVRALGIALDAQLTPAVTSATWSQKMVPNLVSDSANMTRASPTRPRRLWLYRADPGISASDHNPRVGGSSPSSGIAQNPANSEFVNSLTCAELVKRDSEAPKPTGRPAVSRRGVRQLFAKDGGRL